MKKCVKFVTFVSMFILSGSAFAQTGPVFGSLNSAAGSPQARPQVPAVSSPAPVFYKPAAGRMQLADITTSCTRDGEVISAFPGIYKLINSHENSRVIRVFSFRDASGAERRVEVYYTGGDWMQYGFTFVATDAGNDNKVRAYLVGDLSTSDKEDGAIAPRVNPFDNASLAAYISSEFLDASGNVKAVFTTAAAAPASSV